jgi:hypothetical protein
MSDVDRERTVARTVVPIFAALVGLAAVGSMVLILIFAGMCTIPAGEEKADCFGAVARLLAQGVISLALAVCAVLVARKARTAQNAWSGGIVLLIVAVLVSPAVAALVD